MSGAKYASRKFGGLIIVDWVVLGVRMDNGVRLDKEYSSILGSETSQEHKLHLKSKLGSGLNLDPLQG